MSKKISITTDSGEVLIKMNRRGLDHLMMKLDRVRAKVYSEYELGEKDDDIELTIGDASVKSIVFQMEK